MFVLDSIYIRKKCNYYAKKWLSVGMHRYTEIEEEIAGSPEWPPVSPSSSCHANGFLRLDSQLSRIDNKDTDPILPPDTDTETISIKSQSTSPFKSVSSLDDILTHNDNPGGQFDEESGQYDFGDLNITARPLLKQNSVEYS